MLREAVSDAVDVAASTWTSPFHGASMEACYEGFAGLSHQTPGPELVINIAKVVKAWWCDPPLYGSM